MALFSRKPAVWPCAGCGKLNSGGAVYCEFCGLARGQLPEQSSEKEKVICAACGAPCDPNAEFCPLCGISLHMPPDDDVPAQCQRPELQMRVRGVTCLHCGEINPRENRYCAHCSRELRRNAEPMAQLAEYTNTHCPDCGAEYAVGMEYCIHCAPRNEISR